MPETLYMALEGAVFTVFDERYQDAHKIEIRGLGGQGMGIPAERCQQLKQGNYASAKLLLIVMAKTGAV